MAPGGQGATARRGLLGLGSNVGERRANLQAAVDALPAAGIEVLAASSTYDTDPVGEVLDQPSFLNACLTVATALGPLELLVVQPTPFCNLDCDYCYLPDRANTRRMSLETLEQAFRWVFASGLVREPFNLLWHAGEPLVVPVDWYEAAAELLRRHGEGQPLVIQSVQTNATLITKEWCAYFRRHEIDVGVSVDGPAFLHDRCRRTRPASRTAASCARAHRPTWSSTTSTG